jgi:hypothetical protein
MSAQAIARVSLLGSLNNWRLWLIQFIANPAIFGLIAAWLLIPEASAFYLVLQILIALAVFVAIIAIHGGTLVYYFERSRDGNSPLKHVFLKAIRNILPITICLVAFFLLRMLIGMAEDHYQYSLPTYLRSTFPISWRNHISYQFLVTKFSAVIFAFRWIIVPGLMLPFVANAAVNGFRGLGRPGIPIWWGIPRSLSYWLILIVGALLGVLLPSYLGYWTPDFTTSTYGHELFSLIVRLSAAYILGLVAWMLVCAMVGRKLIASTGPGADIPRKPNA